MKGYSKRENRFVEIETKIAKGRAEKTLTKEEEETLLRKSDELWAKLDLTERKSANERCARLYLSFEEVSE